MLKKIIQTIIGLFTVVIIFAACQGGSNGYAVVDGSTVVDGYTVTVVDGYVKNATVTDASGQTATYTSNGKYTFNNAPMYPISTTGGILEDTDLSFDIQMSVSDGASTVISPITTFLGTDSTLLSKFAGLGLGISTLDEFSVDYVSTNDANLAKLSQVLYLILQDSTLTSTFKSSVKNSSSLSSLNDIYTLASTDINASTSAFTPQQISRMNSMITAVKNYSGTAANLESSIKAYKSNFITESTTVVTHNNISYGTVISPHTGKVWLDRNLGASQTCTSMTDSDCYGDYFQWGREADGHEKSTSAVTDTQETSITNTSANFVKNLNWTTADSDRSQRQANWSKTDGTSICPVGYRVPTEAEIKAETSDLTGTNAISNATDLYNSFLSIPAAGYRSRSSGAIKLVGSFSTLSTVTLGVVSDYIKTFDADSSSAEIFLYNGKNTDIGIGASVRCIQD